MSNHLANDEKLEQRVISLHSDNNLTFKSSRKSNVNVQNVVPMFQCTSIEIDLYLFI